MAGLLGIPQHAPAARLPDFSRRHVECRQPAVLAAHRIDADREAKVENLGVLLLRVANDHRLPGNVRLLLRWIEQLPAQCVLRLLGPLADRPGSWRASRCTHRFRSTARRCPSSAQCSAGMSASVPPKRYELSVETPPQFSQYRSAFSSSRAAYIISSWLPWISTTSHCRFKAIIRSSTSRDSLPWSIMSPRKTIRSSRRRIDGLQHGVERVDATMNVANGDQTTRAHIGSSSR